MHRYSIPFSTPSLNIHSNLKSPIQSVIASQIIYCFAIAPIKLSVLFLYKRVFPARNLYIACLVSGAVVLGYSIGQAIGLALQCIPLSSLWTGSPGMCLNANALFTGTA